ncbi:MAG: histidinol dehydrogenase [Solirubrobacterales bacterium]|nr:histidinol dehydrogenase [Solirubrobacterales bacterium]
MSLQARPISSPQRQQAADQDVQSTVTSIITAVRERGDQAVREYAEHFDKFAPDSFRLDPQEVERIVAQVDPQVIDDIRFCQTQVRRFAQAQRAAISDVEVETEPGVTLGHRNIPVSSVGCYVPGGRYPMVASAHMSVVTAKVAGVSRVAVCTPPMRGEAPAETIAAMHLAGADEIYLLGGVQAVAALALGTSQISAVDFLVGPGNAYVAEAKRQLYGIVGIDLLAGPTEILVIADDTADAELVACDLVGQAEHGPTSPAILISLSEPLSQAVGEEVERLLQTLPTADVASVAWRDHGRIITVADSAEALRVADELAAEHVEVQTEDTGLYLEQLHNYGSLFLGPETTVAYGDKTIGTNHILPTARAARYTGGLWVGKFLKTVTYQRCTAEASRRIGEVCARQCRIENFEGHARTCDIRVRRYADAS